MLYLRFSCDGVGDRIRIRNPNLEENGIVKMFEVVITSLGKKPSNLPLYPYFLFYFIWFHDIMPDHQEDKTRFYVGNLLL